MDNTPHASGSDGSRPQQISTKMVDAFLAVESPDATAQRNDSIRARIARLTDKQVLGLAGVAFPKDFPPHLIPLVREQLAITIEQFGDPTATREQAAAHAAGQAVMLHFTGAREVLAEVVTCGVGDRIGWAGVARTASCERRLVGRPNCRPSLNVVAFGVCIQVAAIRAAERMGTLNPTSGVACGVLAHVACAELASRLKRNPDDIRKSAMEFVDWVFDESRGLLLALYMTLQSINAVNPATITHFAMATNAMRLDPRDMVASWFQQECA